MRRGRRVAWPGAGLAGLAVLSACGAEPVHIGTQPSAAPPGANAGDPLAGGRPAPAASAGRSPGTGSPSDGPPPGSLVAGGTVLLPGGLDGCAGHDGQTAAGRGLLVIAVAAPGGRRLVVGGQGGAAVVAITYPGEPATTAAVGQRVSLVGTIRRFPDTGTLGAVSRDALATAERDGCYVDVSDPSSPYLG